MQKFQKLQASGRLRSASSASHMNRRSSVVSSTGSTHTFRSAARMHLSAGRDGDDTRSVGGMSQGTDASTLSKALNKLKSKGTTSTSRAPSIKPRDSSERASNREMLLMQQKVDQLETENSKLRRTEEELKIMTAKADALDSERNDLYVKIANLNGNHNQRMVLYQDEIKQLTAKSQEMHFKVERINQVENGIIEFFLEVKDRSADPERTNFDQEREELRKLNPLVVLDYARANLSNLIAFKESYENELRGELARKKDENEEEIEKLKVKINELTESVVEARQKSEVYLKQLQELEYFKNEMMKESEQVIGDLQRDNQNLINILRQKEQLLSNLKGETENRDSYIKHLQQRNQQIKTLQNQIESTKAFHAAELKKQKVAHGVEIDEMKRKLSRMSMSVVAKDKLERKLQTARKTIIELRRNSNLERVLASEKHSSNASKEVSSVRNELHEWQEKYKELEKANHQLKAEKGRLMSERREMDRMRRQLEHERKVTNKELLREIKADAPSVQMYKDKLIEKNREIEMYKEKLHRYLSSEQKKSQLVRRYELERREYEAQLAKLQQGGGGGSSSSSSSFGVSKFSMDSLRPVSARGPRITVVHNNRKPKRPKTAGPARGKEDSGGSSALSRRPVSGQTYRGRNRRKRSTLDTGLNLDDEEEDDLGRIADGEEDDDNASFHSFGDNDDMSDDGFVPLDELDEVYQLEKENKNLTVKVQEYETVKTAAHDLVGLYSRMIDNTVNDEDVQVPNDPAEIATRIVELNTLFSAPSFGLRQQFTFDRKRMRSKIDQNTKEFQSVLSNKGIQSGTTTAGGMEITESSTIDLDAMEEQEKAAAALGDEDGDKKELEHSGSTRSLAGEEGLTRKSSIANLSLRPTARAALAGIQSRNRVRRNLTNAALESAQTHESTGGEASMEEESMVVRHGVTTQSETYERFRDESSNLGNPPKSPRLGSAGSGRDTPEKQSGEISPMGHGESRFQIEQKKEYESTVNYPKRNRTMNKGRSKSTLLVGTL